MREAVDEAGALERRPEEMRWARPMPFGRPVSGSMEPLRHTDLVSTCTVRPAVAIVRLTVAATTAPAPMPRWPASASQRLPATRS